MRRQSPPKAAASIALFPFLAVLLCTMGGLIVLLVVIARHSKQQAVVDCQASIAARDDLELRRSDIEWRNGHLRSSRDKTAEQLGERRTEISHLEDHMRRLRDQLAELDRALADFDRDASAKEHDTAQMRARVNELQEQVRATEQEIDKNKRARPRSESYAVIPYSGPHQTHRRPIYIECSADAIILQPEGIELVDTDFLGPSWPGNPLAAGLRAAREYLVKNLDKNPLDDGDPYPLLLVRPDGILSYYAAREAMSSWGSDFGYEFIDQDWQLQYKPPDPNMVVAMARAVDDARHRQDAIALAAPRALSSRQRRARRSASAGRSSDALASGTVLTGAAPTGSGDKGTAAAGGNLPGNNQGRATPDLPSGQEQQPTSAGLNMAPPNQAGGADGPTLKGLETPGKPFNAQARASASAADTSLDAPPTAEEVRTPKRSIAKSRGKDWSLPGNHQGAVAVTRPILVRCYGDHLVVLHEAGDKQVSEVIPLSYSTQDSVDPLVNCIRQRIDSWGLTGRGMYWRPTLVVEVEPDGHARYADLRELLTDSGLDLSEKSLAGTPVSAPQRY